MKKVILIIAFVFSGMLIQAQVNSQENKYEFKYYQDTYERAIKMKTSGTVLVLTGLVLTNASLISYIGNGNEHNAFSALSLLGGFAAINVGIPLWVAGGIKSKNNLDRIHSIKQNINLSMNSTKNGVGLVLNF